MSDSNSATAESDAKVMNAARSPELASKTADSSTGLVEIGNEEDEVLDLDGNTVSSSNAREQNAHMSVDVDVAVVAFVSEGAGTPVGGKREAEELNGNVAIEGEQDTPPSVARPRLNINKAAKIESAHSARTNGKERCKFFSHGEILFVLCPVSIFR